MSATDRFADQFADRSAERLADRYGTRPSSRRTVTVAAWALVAAALLAFLTWAALHWATPEVRGTRLAYEVRTDSVLVTISVQKDARATAVCRLRALDRDFRVVGTAQVRVAPPANGADSTLVVTVPTRSASVTGELIGCSGV